MHRIQEDHQLLKVLQQEYCQLGFTSHQIQKAFEQALCQQNEILDEQLIYKPTISPQVLQKTSDLSMQKDEQKDQKNQYDQFELPEQNQRELVIPTGLAYKSDLCYINSLIQVYFHNPVFVSEILKYQYPLSLNFQNLIQVNEMKAKRIKSSINLVTNLQSLFAHMVFTSKQYIDASPIMMNVVDDFGLKIKIILIGNRQIIRDFDDISDFNLQFLACIEEGLRYDERKLNYLQHNTRISQVKVVPIEDCKTHQKKNMNENSQTTLIKELFFSRSKNTFQYSEDNHLEELVEENDQLFLAIVLGIEHKDLYTSWEANSRSQIQDQRIKNGNQTQCKKFTWMTKLPEQLFFQISRKRGGRKQKDEFKFQKEIYTDYFLLSNKESSLINQNRIELLRNQKQQLEIDLLQYENHNDIGLNVLTFLGCGEQFSKSQDTPQSTKQKSESSGSMEFVLCKNDSNVLEDFLTHSQGQLDSAISLPQFIQTFSQDQIDEKQNQRQSHNLYNTLLDNEEEFQILSPYDTLDRQEKSIPNTIKDNQQMIEETSQDEFQILSSDKKQKQNKFSQALQNMSNHVQEICFELNNSIRDKMIEINTLYESSQRHKYIINSILIHDHSIKDHYFVYIHNLLSGKWLKFEDVHVSEESEEKVFKDAFGDGISERNAYCITYHKVGGMIQQCKYYPNPIDRLSIQKDLVGGQNSYSQLINDDLRQEVLNVNIKFEQEMSEQKLNQLADTITEVFYHKFQFIQERVKQFKDSSFGKSKLITPVCNFSVFLAYNLNESNEIIRLSVLDSAIREVTSKNLTIYNLSKNSTMFQKLQFNLQKSGLNLQEYSNMSQNMEINLKEYILQLRNQKITQNLFSTIEKEQWKESLSIMKNILESNNEKEQTNLVSEIYSVMLLILTCQLYNRYEVITFQKFWQTFELIIAYTASITNTIILQQIQLMLQDFYDLRGSTITNQEQQMLFISYTKSIPERPYYPQLSCYKMDIQFDSQENNKDYFDWKIDDHNIDQELDQSIVKFQSKFKKWISLYQNLIKTNCLILNENRIKLGLHKNLDHDFQSSEFLFRPVQ